MAASHYKQQGVCCPHCDHTFNKDEMLACAVDLFALAPNEETACVECPVCDGEFWVKGSYRPEYSTAFAEELL